MNHLFVTVLGAALISSAAFAVEPAPVVTGGVGDASQRAIKQVQDNYSLKLVFTGEGGMYLSEVDVSIRDKQGLQVVKGISQGPFLLAELQPGTYTVEAETEGYNMEKQITIGDDLKTYHMRFPIKDNVDVSLR